jgi:hypothetical protein
MVLTHFQNHILYHAKFIKVITYEVIETHIHTAIYNYNYM